MLNEQSIKVAVIDRLFETGSLNDAVLINEMVYANWSRRADLAIANGHLHAFEVKSELDSLRRLAGQIETYLERFDKLTLVVSPKFVNEVLAITPDRVGIWEAAEEKGLTKLRVVRTGRQVRIHDKEVLVGYLLRDELYRFLLERGEKVGRNQTKSDLVSMALNQPLNRLRSYLLHAIKERYRPSFELFISKRGNKTSLTDIASLRKSKAVSNKVNIVAQEHAKCSTSRRVKLDLSRLFAEGEIPNGIPDFIVARNKISRKRRS